jgi:anti-sigma factor ChrR (cupin superfamily)
VKETIMLINADFSQRAAVLADQYQWVPSPQGGVERVMLDRIGGEQARATSIVRYAKGSRFPSHTHPAGEEILVLSGTFSEDGKDFPAGWYMRSPPGSAHQPSSEEGALIFVKLRQMLPSEKEFVRHDTNDPANWAVDGNRSVCKLFANGAEQVTLERLPSGARVFSAPVEGVEIFVVAGEVREDHQPYAKGSWIRLPAGNYASFAAGPEGAILYLKRGAFPASLKTEPAHA